ncbi:MAG TPA: RNA polymerase sigma factor [Azospira sp.]|nr:RNA polymerase sigma factor [Azospira sp.]
MADTSLTAAAFDLPPGDDEKTLEQTLVQRIVAGDRKAFELLMRRHNRRLFRLARATLRNDADAEDALQEAYIAAYRAMGQFRGAAAVGTWLSRLVLNECLGRLRRQARRDNVIPMQSLHDDTRVDAMTTPDHDSPEKALLRSELRALLERKLDALPESFRLVFVLRCVEEMSVEETAAYLEIPEATVRSRLFRARSQLRDALAQEIDLAQRDVYEFGGGHCDRIVNNVLSRLEQLP